MHHLARGSHTHAGTDATPLSTHAHPHTLTYEHAYAAIRTLPRTHARNDRIHVRTHAFPSARPPLCTPSRPPCPARAFAGPRIVEVAPCGRGSGEVVAKRARGRER